MRIFIGTSVNFEEEICNQKKHKKSFDNEILWEEFWFSFFWEGYLET